MISYNIPFQFGDFHIGNIQTANPNSLLHRQYGLNEFYHGLNDFYMAKDRKVIWSLEKPIEIYPLLNLGYEMVSFPDLEVEITLRKSVTGIIISKSEKLNGKQ